MPDETAKTPATPKTRQEIAQAYQDAETKEARAALVAQFPVLTEIYSGAGEQ